MVSAKIITYADIVDTEFIIIDEKLADYINILLEESYKEMQIDTKEKQN